MLWFNALEVGRVCLFDLLWSGDLAISISVCFSSLNEAVVVMINWEIIECIIMI